jgi:carboxyl-terminal processing protease
VRKNQRLLILIAGLILYTFLVIMLFSKSDLPFKSNDRYLNRFIENYNLLKDDWYFFTDEKNVINDANSAIATSNYKNDPYTMYIPSEKSIEYFSQLESDYVGIGITYFMSDEHPIITQIFEHSPAKKAGLKVGDNIIKIDGKDVKGLTAEQNRALVSGKVGTKVKLTILRNDQLMDIQVTRQKLDSSVVYDMKKKSHKGYLKLSEFTNTSVKEVKSVLKTFKENKIKTLILDLRGNPGGYLTAVQGIADLFLPKGKVIMQTKDAHHKVQRYLTADSEKQDFTIKILVDHNTASAAEVLSACLQENANAKLYGETTFGKGLMQTHYKYKDGAYMKYTNAEWLTPRGKSINKIGIKPDVAIKKSPIYDVLNLSFNNKKAIKNNTVNANLISYQKTLKALGYAVDRFDGYYSPKTNKAVNAFKSANRLISQRDLSTKVQSKIIEVMFIKSQNSKYDNVLNAVY